jgi:hypothetical protein
LTYKAYLDFVLRHSPLDYYTVDADFGCGVIRRSVPPAVLAQRGRAHRSREGSASPASPRDHEHDRLAAEWLKLGDDHAAAFRFFRRHFRPLLRLRAAEEFLEIERAKAVPPAG